ncbi:hypothetical protein V8E36_003818 [Tilletia maclaganii]
MQPEAAELPCRSCYVAGEPCRVLAGSVRSSGCRKGKTPCNVPSFEPPKTNAINDWTPKYLRERLGADRMSVSAVQDYLQTHRRNVNAVDAPAHVQPSLASGSGPAPRYDLLW